MATFPRSQPSTPPVFHWITLSELLAEPETEEEESPQTIRELREARG